MNKRDIAIVNWVKQNRPDLNMPMFNTILNDDEHINFLMAIAFEAGRVFQKDNPNATNGPADY
jgi:hypothetical protein